MKLVTVLVLIASTARANVWQDAVDPHATDKRGYYRDALAKADDAARAANSKSANAAEAMKMVASAVKLYREAAKIAPDEGEPYYRIGYLLYSFYLDCPNVPAAYQPNPSPLCDPSSFDRAHAEQVIAAWDAFEARSPLDPRLGVDVAGGSHVLFERAILHTKLYSNGHLEAAARDYQKIVERAEASMLPEQVLGNLAETYMMLDRLDEAIDTYRQVYGHGARSSVAFGLAVALDRDGRGDQARDVILAQGDAALRKFHEEVMNGDSFFVPHGEEYYYFALGEEAFDRVDNALDYWKEYIDSGAHPEFQARAREHIAQLKGKPRVPPPPPIDWERRW